VSPSRSFTGRGVRRTTRPSVRVVDRIARLAIMLGGIGTILAVSTVCVFLVWVVVPLFRDPEIAPAATVVRPRGPAEAVPVRTAIDEHGTAEWTVFSDGTVRVRRLDDGSTVHEVAAFADPVPTAWSFSNGGSPAVVGYADGTVRLADLGFAVEFLDSDAVPERLRGIPPGSFVDVDGVLYHRTADNQFRVERLAVALDPPFRLSSPVPGVVGSADDGAAPVVLVDVVRRTTGPVVAALAADGLLRVAEVSTSTNLLTGETSVDLTGGEFRIAFDPAEGPPRWLEMTGLGDNVLLGWPSGRLARVDTRDLSAIHEVESVDLVPESGRTMTALGMLLGETTVLAGDDAGRIRAWFRIRSADGEPAGVDGMRLTMAHELPAGGSAVRSLASSARSRIAVAGFDDGSARLYNVTGERLLVSAPAAAGSGPAVSVALSPKDDRLIVEGPGGLATWIVDAPHPEASPSTIFRPVWYEGYLEPEHVWQSSSGTDDFEPKYGLMPLVFGTVKATFYSMLFGLPLALLAAVYTSEFMHRRTRAKVKPTIELMASLPSVVLGFLSALVIAPLVENVVPQVLAAVLTVPAAFLLGGYLWQLAPRAWAVRHEALRAAGIAAALAVGIAAAFGVGPWVERGLFAGDLRSWLAGQIGSGFGGWVLLTFPLCALAVGWVSIQWVNPRIREWARGGSYLRAATLNLVKFGAGLLAVLALTFAVAGVLAALGFDPRGGVLDTYVQRNALVVGFIMGFAIIPIIYTISEDALSSVPEHLRAASLGAGATPWQTAVRIIIPTAMSGLFSAVMIGLGRAVGETMIVLMAAGNTPIMDWNVFNGFRTLSANIAVELPEAVKNSTHYRMLFLAALTLFALTFALNTAAEIVRQRFRKRAFQL